MFVVFGKIVDEAVKKQLPLRNATDHGYYAGRYSYVKERA
jgi:hypothetical protein